MPSELSSKDRYKLELAIDASKKEDVLKEISSIFGLEKIKESDSISFVKRGDLFFIEHQFTSEQLSDKNYKKLLKNKKVCIISDTLSIKRAAKLLEICLPVEVQLKKLLIYVYPGIIGALDGKNNKKSQINLCNQIMSWNLGVLLERLEFDLSLRSREELFIKNGEKLVDILNKSASFDEFKKAIMFQIRPNTVWNQVNTILKRPVDYCSIKKDLHLLRYLRNKAAHPQTIMNSELTLAKEKASNVINSIGEIKEGYKNELSESMKSLEKVISETMQTYTPQVQKLMNEYLRAVLMGEINPQNVKKYMLGQPEDPETES